MHPFKWFQTKLGIAQEWQALKQNIRPHKFTLLLVIGVGTFPFYKKYLISAKNKTNEWFKSQVFNTEKIDNSIQNYSKKYIIQQYLVKQVLNDQKIIQEMSNFSEKVSKEVVTQEATKILLLKAIRSKEFEDQAEFLSKNITGNLLEDSEIQQKSEQLVDRILASQKVQDALEESLIKVINTEKMKDTLQNLFERTFLEDQFQASVSALLERSFGDLLNNPDTVVKLKQFVSYIMDTNYGRKNKKQNIEVKYDN